jgi:hypothetical protein
MDEKIYIKTGNIINCIEKSTNGSKCKIMIYEIHINIGIITLSDEKIIPNLMTDNFISELTIEISDFNLTKNILKKVYKNNNVLGLSVDLDNTTNYIMDILKINTSVEQLYLSGNYEIDDMINMLKINTSIKLLDVLTTDDMNCDESEKLMKMLESNKNIKILQLDNVFHKESIPNLVEMLKINKSIKEIHLGYVEFNEDEYKILLNVLNENVNIIKFNFESMHIEDYSMLKKYLEKNKLIHTRQIKNFAIYQYLFLNRIPRYIKVLISKF